MSSEFGKLVKNTAIVTAGFSLLIPVLLATRNCEGDKQNISPLNYSVSNNIPEAPKYNLRGLECSGYVRNAAEDLFGKEFSWSNAWDRIHNDDVVVSNVANNDELITYVNQGVLKPGMVLGIRCPGSSFSDRLDQTGNPVRNTHNELYLGAEDVNRNGKFDTNELYFAHQFITNIERITLEDMNQRGLEAVYIVDSKN